MRKGVPKNFAKFTGKHLYQGLFFKKSFLKKIVERRALVYLE